MNIVVGARASGKTYQMVEWWKEDPEHRVIITLNLQTRRDLIDRGVEPHSIYIMAEAPQSMRGVTATVGIDADLEAMLYHALGLHPVFTPIGLVTINGAAKDGQGNIITPVFDNPHLRAPQ